jgi:hypothetical protein
MPHPNPPVLTIKPWQTKDKRSISKSFALLKLLTNLTSPLSLLLSSPLLSPLLLS